MKLPSSGDILKLWKEWDKTRPVLVVLVSTFTLITALFSDIGLYWRTSDGGLPRHIPELAVARCRQLRLTPEDHLKSRGVRTQSDRYVPGTKPVLLRHGKIWTGEANGTDLVHGDILLDKGLIKSVGHLSLRELDALRDDLVTIDLNGKWVTPGLVDMHSHIGVNPAPQLVGSEDYNSNTGNIQVSEFQNRYVLSHSPLLIFHSLFCAQLTVCMHTMCLTNWASLAELRLL